MTDGLPYIHASSMSHTLMVYSHHPLPSYVQKKRVKCSNIIPDTKIFTCYDNLWQNKKYKCHTIEIYTNIRNSEYSPLGELLLFNWEVDNSNLWHVVYHHEIQYTYLWNYFTSLLIQRVNRQIKMWFSWTRTRLSPKRVSESHETLHDFCIFSRLISPQRPPVTIFYKILLTTVSWKTLVELASRIPYSFPFIWSLYYIVFIYCI